ncbi:hypothetical protein A4R44_05150 [Amycolatopsis sp. M39]|nr:hypothetical protein A4R44_05150 [Amycolatopsis sp. M39]
MNRAVSPVRTVRFTDSSSRSTSARQATPGAGCSSGRTRSRRCAGCGAPASSAARASRPGAAGCEPTGSNAALSRRPRPRAPARPVSASRLVGAGGAGGVGDAVIAGHGQHVGLLPVPERVAQAGGVLAVGLVPGHPPGREVKLPIDEDMPGGGRIHHEHRHLRIPDPPRRAGVLPLHPDRAAALLEVPGLVDDHRVLLAQVLDHEPAQVVADTVGVPDRPRQQVPHPVRGPVPDPLGDRPAIRPRQPGQQTPHEPRRAAAGHDTPEPARDPGERLTQHRPPHHGVHAGSRGHHTILSCPHKHP